MSNRHTVYMDELTWRHLKASLDLQGRSISSWMRDSAIEYLNNGERALDSRRSFDVSRRRENCDEETKENTEGDSEMLRIKDTT